MFLYLCAILINMNEDIELEFNDYCGGPGESPYIVIEEDDEPFDSSQDAIHPFLYKKDVMKC